jgi:cyclopropane fatty-acyl-phospholipid synthase-like methyltransferase
LSQSSLIYHPEIFNQKTLQGAAKCILDHHSESFESRWERETDYLIELWKQKNLIPKGGVVVDFGCGIGRLSKRMIQEFDVTVVGVDLSVEMLQHAISYVGSPQFVPMPRASLDKFEIKADFAVAAWVLQHCPFIEEEIRALEKVLKPQGIFFCLNAHGRFIPIQNSEWADDSVQVGQVLQSHFNLVEISELPLTVTSKEIQEMSWWGTFVKKS